MSDSSRGYPRPLLERPEWFCLDGPWDFAFDDAAVFEHPGQVQWDRTINVPFSPETPLSGINETGFHPICWYRRNVDTPGLQPGQRLILHFGAIDYDASIWVNNHLAARHEGGYTPISTDITRFVLAEGPQTIVVRALDDPHDLAKPRGKQEWQLEPHGIWYPRTSGIWQTVWLEVLNESSIASVHWTPNVERWELGFEARIDGPQQGSLRLTVRLTTDDDIVLAEDTYTVLAGEVHRRIALSDPGIDDYRNELLWTPSTPTLIHAELTLRRGDHTIDQAHSYTALRSLSISGDRFLLNGRPYHLAMILDQGYWPDGGLTAPTDAHFRQDVELAKAMGFNGVRKHQKIEDPRYLYWADTLGLLVWEEMPSAYRFTKDSVQRLTREWLEAIQRDRSHPCIIAWVPFNESWGVPDLPDSPAQRHWVQGVYHLTKTMDPTRPVIGNDGWESVATDIIGVHDYDEFPERLAARYGPHALRLFQKERPAGRQLLLGQKHKGQPVMLTEFGGIAFSQDPDRTWGYSRALNEADFTDRYRKLLAVVRPAPLLSGFCYTQFADTYQESNGLLYADRKPKIPIEQLALATRGPRSYREPNWEIYWREQLMSSQRASYVVPPEDRRTGDPR